MSNGSEYLQLYKQSKQDLFVVTLILAIALLLYRWQAFSNLNTHLFGGASLDAGLYYYLFNHHQLNYFNFSNWFNVEFYYPYHKVLAWSDNFILPAYFAKPLASLNISVTAQYNLTLLTSLLLNGICTYILAYSLCGLFLASLSCGLAIFFASFIHESSGHPQLLFFFWLPLGLFFFLKFLSEQRFVFIFLAGLSIVLCFLCSVYYALFLVLLYVLLSSGLILLRPKHYAKLINRSLILATIVNILIITPFAWPYIKSSQHFGARHLYEPFFLSASVSSYFQGAANSFLYSSFSQHGKQVGMEAGLFAGLTLLGLVIFAVCRLCINVHLKRQVIITGLIFFTGIFLADAQSYSYRIVASICLWLSIINSAMFLYKLGLHEQARQVSALTNRSLLAVLLVISQLLVILSLGPLANSDWREVSISPYALFYYVFPGFSALRSAYRLGFVALLLLFLLIPFILPLIQKRFKRLGSIVILLLTALIIIENWQIAYPLEEVQRPLVLVNQPKGATLFLPLQDNLKADNPLLPEPASYAKYNVTAMLQSLPVTQNQHPIKIINGYSGHIPRLNQKLLNLTKDFPSSSSLYFLSSFVGLENIIYHSSNVANFNTAIFEQQLSQSTWVSTIEKFAENSYLLSFKPENEIAAEMTLFIPSDNSVNLNLELKAQAGDDHNPCDVIISIQESATQAQLLDRLELPRNGQYQNYSIGLAHLKNGIRPATINILNSCGQVVFLRGRGLS